MPRRFYFHLGSRRFVMWATRQHADNRPRLHLSLLDPEQPRHWRRLVWVRIPYRVYWFFVPRANS